jgi:tagaturonate reductase
MRLTEKNIPLIHEKVDKPTDRLFQLPERILQFGTGVLLRGLCDFVVHDANKKGAFNGRIVVVKSTDSGDTNAFRDQNNLYTVCIRGLNNGEIVEENIICSSISRVLSARHEWEKVLQTVVNPSLNIIISNTTEVGLQLLKEDVFMGVPSSFPGKLLRLLLRRFEKLGDSGGSSMIVIPTELISDNGEKLRDIVSELARYNAVDGGFMSWLEKRVVFCNSLVDRIVTKDPGEQLLKKIEAELGYEDELLTMCENYLLWAIQGSVEVEKIISFASAGNGAFVKADIDVFKFLKLHLLNGTHTLSAPLAFLAGFETVRQAMSDEVFSRYVASLMKKNIALAIPYEVAADDIENFSDKVLDRFSNPFLQHKWINITLQSTMKMRMRNVPVILRYHQLYDQSPPLMATGFAGYLLFMKPAKIEQNVYYGSANGEYYPINDDQAAFFHHVWNEETLLDEKVTKVLSNIQLWGHDLATLTPFAESVTEKLSSMMKNGVCQTLSNI